MTNKVKPNQDDAAREAPHEDPTEIVSAEIHEISLVDKPSNRRRLLSVRAEEAAANAVDVRKATIRDVPQKISDRVREALNSSKDFAARGLDIGEAVVSIVYAMKTLQTYIDYVPQNLLAELFSAFGMSVTMGEPQMRKSPEEEIPEPVRKTIEAQRAALEEQNKRIAAFERREKKAHFAEIAKRSMPNIAGKPDEIAESLLVLSERAPEIYEFFERSLSAASVKIGNLPQFSEIGSAADGAEVSPFQTAAARRFEDAKAAGKPISALSAMAAALAENPSICEDQ